MKMPNTIDDICELPRCQLVHELIRWAFYASSLAHTAPTLLAFASQCTKDVCTCVADISLASDELSVKLEVVIRIHLLNEIRQLNRVMSTLYSVQWTL